MYLGESSVEALAYLAALLESLDASVALSLGALERLLVRVGVFAVFVYGLWTVLKGHWRRRSGDRDDPH